MSFSSVSILSNVLGFHTNVYVTLPKDHGEAKPYRTLYLLHGGSGEGKDWLRFSSAERWANEAGVALVMPEVGGDSFYADMKHGYRYFTYLADELPVVMQYMFPLSDKREDHLVAGLSMGGYGAFKWAFNRPDFFTAAANLSGMSFITDLFGQDHGTFSNQERLDMMERDWGGLEGLRGSMDDSRRWLDEAAGKADKYPRLFAGIGTEDYSYQFAVDYAKAAEEKGVPIHFETMPGKHEWSVWDEMLKRFLKWEAETR